MNKAQEFLIDKGQSDLLLKDSKDFSKRVYLSDLLQEFSFAWPPNKEVENGQAVGCIFVGNCRSENSDACTRCEYSHARRLT